MYSCSQQSTESRREILPLEEVQLNCTDRYHEACAEEKKTNDKTHSKQLQSRTLNQ